ncbi:MAG: CBS domain-containing protein, partial [Cyanobacteria bacterium J06633_1]
MESHEQLFASPDVESAIDRSPLVISPDTSLVRAIALMGRARGISCKIEASNDSEYQLDTSGRSSCALVMKGDELQGILTERDVVRFTAEKLAFNTVSVRDVMTRSVVTLAKSSLKDIFAALFLFRRYRVRHLPIVDETNKLMGIMTPESIRLAMRPANLLKMRRVGDVMSKDIIHAPMTETVLSVAQLMAKHRV